MCIKGEVFSGWDGAEVGAKARVRIDAMCVVGLRRRSSFSSKRILVSGVNTHSIDIASLMCQGVSASQITNVCDISIHARLLLKGGCRPQLSIQSISCLFPTPGTWRFQDAEALVPRAWRLARRSSPPACTAAVMVARVRRCAHRLPALSAAHFPARSPDGRCGAVVFAHAHAGMDLRAARS